MSCHFMSFVVTRRRLVAYNRNTSYNIISYCSFASAQSSRASPVLPLSLQLSHLLFTNTHQQQRSTTSSLGSRCFQLNHGRHDIRDFQPRSISSSQHSILSRSIEDRESSSLLSLSSSLKTKLYSTTIAPVSSQPGLYQVLRISGYGTVQEYSLSVTDLLERHSGFHVRDLFALKLTTKKTKSKSYIKYMSRPRPVILPRGDEIIIAFGCVRAVIGRESAMLFDAHDPNVKFLASELVELFQSRPFSYKDPFELVFVEEILRDACNTFDLRLKVYEPIVDSSLNQISVAEDSEANRLVPIKDSLQEFEIQVKQSLKCLTNMLGNEEDLLNLLITEKAEAQQKGRKLDFGKHMKVELLFEEYARQLDNILHEIQYLMKRIQSKHEMVALSMDSFRNRWLRVNVYLSIVGISLATSTTVAGYFGMNMINGLEDSPTAFHQVTLMTSLGGLALFGGCTTYVRGTMMRRAALQRVKEIETIHSALEDMTMVDYAAKTTLKSNETIDKKKFIELLSQYKGKQVSESEADLLFQALDTTKDGVLHFDDFRPYKYDEDDAAVSKKK